MLSPWASWNRPEAAARSWSSVRATDVDSTSPSVLPDAATPPSTASSRGWFKPYPGRGKYSKDKSTRPSVHVARRRRT